MLPKSQALPRFPLTSSWSLTSFSNAALRFYFLRLQYLPRFFQVDPPHFAPNFGVKSQESISTRILLYVCANKSCCSYGIVAMSMGKTMITTGISMVRIVINHELIETWWNHLVHWVWPLSEQKTGSEPSQRYFLIYIVDVRLQSHMRF